MSDLNDSCRMPIPLSFQPGLPGSAEHYFHFLLGYILPILQILDVGCYRQGRREHFLVRSCGPVMDAVLDEVLQAFGVSYEKSSASDPRYSSSTAVKVPRWDLSLFLGGDASSTGSVDTFHSDSLHRLGDVRGQVLDLAYSKRSVPDQYADKILLLKRSAEPDFYRSDGVAEIARYGVGRRSLSGLNWAKDVLTAAGHAAEIYEPGAHTFFDQVRTFHACRGIVGIRGAELANMLWMKRGAFSVVLNVGNAPYRHLDYLSDHQGLHLEVLDRRAEGPHLSLKASDLAAIPGEMTA